MSGKNRKTSQRLVGPCLETALHQQRLNYIFYMFTDARTSTTEMLMTGTGAEEITARAFRTEIQDGLALLPGVVSRKKQVIPALMGVCKQMIEEK